MRVSCRLCTLEVAETANRSPVEILSVLLPSPPRYGGGVWRPPPVTICRTPVSSDSVKRFIQHFRVDYGRTSRAELLFAIQHRLPAGRQVLQRAAFRPSVPRHTPVAVLPQFERGAAGIAYLHDISGKRKIIEPLSIGATEVQAAV